MFEYYSSFKFQLPFMGKDHFSVTLEKSRKILIQNVIFIVFLAGICSGFSFSNSSYAASEPAKSWRFTCYAFRDVNRNGIFDIGDRPFAGLGIEMTRPDGSNISSRSNINGFTPFIVSLNDNEKAAVYNSGIYRIRSKAPNGFTFTSSLDKQSFKFVGQSNARGRLVPTELCLPVGVAPILSIGGRLIPDTDTDLSKLQITAILNDKKEFPINHDEGGYYSFIGQEGNWRLEVRTLQQEVVYQREFKVADLPVRLSNIDLSIKPNKKLAGKVSTLSFDDLLLSDTLFEIPSGYGELSWLNWIATHSQFYKGSGYVNLTTSSEYMAYNSSGMPGQVSSKEPFDFVGTNVGVAWPRGEEEDVIFRAWNDNKLIYEDHISPSDKTPVSFIASYNRITRLEIRSGNYERIVIDDFQYRK